MDYFDMQTILPDVRLITEPYYREHANLYLFTGERALLIDCGLGFGDIKSFLQSRGFDADVTLTHRHFDHAGGLRHFLPEQVELSPGILSGLEREGVTGTDYLKEEDFIAAEVERLFGKTPHDLCAEFASRIQYPVPAHGVEVIRAGSHTFQIIEAPGHTRDSVVLYDTHAKLLISGDALYDGEPYVNFPDSDINAFLATLTLLQSLDFDLVLPGHNAVMRREAALRVVERWRAIATEKLEQH